MIRHPSDKSADILPRNATPLERDLLRVEGFDILEPEVDRIATAKFPDRPDDILPWLVVEYNLVPYMEWVPDLRTLVIEGLELNKILGTAAAVQHVARWLSYTDVSVIEHTKPNIHFPEWQLRLNNNGLLLDTEDVCRLARIMALVQPVRSRFRRIFNAAYDRKQMVWSGADNQWGNFYSGVSGVRPKELGYCKETGNMQVSLGRIHDFTSPAPLFGSEVPYYHVHRRLHRALVAPAPWPVLDDEHHYSFYPTNYSVDNSLRINNVLVNELGEDIVSSGEAAEGSIPPGLGSPDGGLYLTSPDGSLYLAPPEGAFLDDQILTVIQYG